MASDRDRAQGAEAVPRPRPAGRRSGPRQDHRGLHGAEGVHAARHGRAHPGADAGIACRPVAGGAGEQVRADVRHHLRSRLARGPCGVLEPGSDRRVNRHSPAQRACRAPARTLVRPYHRRRGAPPARPLEPELEARRCPQQALSAAAVGDAGAERPDRALQSPDAAQARHLQDPEGVSRRLYDPGQAAPAGEPRAPARPHARRHDPQHPRGGGPQAAAPARHDNKGRRRSRRGQGLCGARRHGAAAGREGWRGATASDAAPPHDCGGIVPGRCGGCAGANRRAERRRSGVGGAGRALGRNRAGRQGGRADRAGAQQSSREEADLRPSARDFWRTSATD